jgi:lipoate-protein ligase B
MAIDVIDWGHLAYREAHRRQLEAHDARLRGDLGDTVFLVEHPHVYTYGRGHTEPAPNTPTTILGETVDRVPVERGGDVTYHGPGQLVAYPIIDVRALTGDLHGFLHWLEEIIIRTIAHWDIVGTRNPGYTGVWVGDRKIASIGIAIRKWISYHGIALNVATDLRFYTAIEPCGLPAAVMTSMEELTGQAIALEEVQTHFQAVLSSEQPSST